MAVYKLTPTKANLLRAKSSLAFMKTGYELLDKKRVVLIRETAGLLARAKELEAEIDEVLQDYYRAMANAFITVGSAQLEEIARRVRVDTSIDIIEHSLMGVPVPEVRSDAAPLDLGYRVQDLSLDHALSRLERFRRLLLELAAVRNSVDRVRREITKTQKRANALDKVQIPKYTRMVSDIEQELEEKEREEFFRLKLVKKSHGRKSS